MAGAVGWDAERRAGERPVGAQLPACLSPWAEFTSFGEKGRAVYKQTLCVAENIDFFRD